MFCGYPAGYPEQDFFFSFLFFFPCSVNKARPIAFSLLERDASHPPARLGDANGTEKKGLTTASLPFGQQKQK
jgi:hypothetical protein